MRSIALVVLAAGCGRFGFGGGAGSDGAVVADVAPDADTSGLVAYYPMDTLAADATPDATGHGHTAMCSTAMATCPTPVAGKLGTALRFDGSNDHFTITDATDLDTIAGFTIAAWVWIDVTPPAVTCFANKPIGSMTEDTWQICIEANLSLYFGTSTMPNGGGGDSLLSPSGVMTTLAWHHLAVTWDGTKKTIWYDGGPEAVDQAATTFDPSPILLGYDLDNGAPVAAFSGILDEVRIYNRALSASELATLAGI